MAFLKLSVLLFGTLLFLSACGANTAQPSTVPGLQVQQNPNTNVPAQTNPGYGYSNYTPQPANPSAYGGNGSGYASGYGSGYGSGYAYGDDCGCN